MLIAAVLTAVTVIFFLVSILFIIMGERRALAEVQGREGPSVAGFGGVFQALVDGIKTFFKAVLVSRRAFKVWFFLLPAVLLVINIMKFTILPLSGSGGFVDFEYDWVLLNVLGSFEVFIFVFATWSVLSSKFPTIATLREVAQQCAVEALIGFCLLITVLYAGTLSIRTVVDAQEYVWYFFVVTPYAYIYYLAVLAELHRTPMDLTEAESELTAGYQAEHGGILFSLFYLSEYGGIVVSALVFSLLFLGGWFLPLGIYAHFIVLFLKVVTFAWFIVITRATLPRVRIRALASVTWSHLLPFSSSAVSTYLWLGIVLAAFRVCEYCVYGVELFRAHVRRFYYLGRNFWHYVSSEHDNRIDTALGGFAYMRQFMDWGQPGKIRTVGNTGAPYMTYPENQRLASSIQLAGGTAVLAERHYSEPFDADRGKQNLMYVPHPFMESTLWHEHDATVLAQRDMLYWQEMLDGDFARFDEWSRTAPSRDIIARYVKDEVTGRPVEGIRAHHDVLDPFCDLEKPDNIERRALQNIVGEVWPAAGLASRAELEDDTFLRLYGDQPGAVEYLANSALLREHYPADKKPYAPGVWRTWGNSAFAWGGVQTNPYTSPTALNEFLPLLGVTAETAGLSEAERFAFYESLADDACVESFNAGTDAYNLPYFERMIRPAITTTCAIDPALGVSDKVYWGIVNENLGLPKRGSYRADLEEAMESVLQPEYAGLPDLYKKYYGIAAFTDGHMQEYLYFNTVQQPNPDPNPGPHPYTDESYVRSGFYGYVFGPRGYKYYPRPQIINIGCPDMVDNNPARYMRPGVDPIATVVRYQGVSN